MARALAYRVDTAEVQTWMRSTLTPLGLWDAVAPA